MQSHGAADTQGFGMLGAPGRASGQSDLSGLVRGPEPVDVIMADAQDAVH